MRQLETDAVFKMSYDFCASLSVSKGGTSNREHARVALVNPNETSFCKLRKMLTFPYAIVWSYDTFWDKIYFSSILSICMLHQPYLEPVKHLEMHFKHLSPGLYTYMYSVCMCVCVWIQVYVWLYSHLYSYTYRQCFLAGLFFWLICQNTSSGIKYFLSMYDFFSLVFFVYCLFF